MKQHLEVCHNRWFNEGLPLCYITVNCIVRLLNADDSILIYSVLEKLWFSEYSLVGKVVDFIFCQLKSAVE